MNMHPPRQSEGDEDVTEMRKAEGGAERLLKRFGCTNDMMINNYPSPMKVRGQVYSNEE
jgi:hypothetical protein